MPAVFRSGGYRFFFLSNEGNPREPSHIHVHRAGIVAKFWLWPEVKVALNDGFNARELRELSDIIEQHRDEITRTWDDFFGSG